MKNLIQYKDFEGKAVKDVDSKGRTITGYFAAFNNVDLGGDLIEPGAFAKTIMERGPQGQNKVFFLNQHDSWQVLGKPAVLKEDSYGLYHESKVADTTLGNDVLKLYQEGIMDSFSFGYRTITENRVEDVNHLKELYLYEGSAVTFPMNESAITTGIKSIETINKKIKEIEKFCKDTTASDETIELLLLNIKQLQQEIINISTTKPDKSTSPGTVIKDAAVLNTINLFTKSVNHGN